MPARADSDLGLMTGLRADVAGLEGAGLVRLASWLAGGCRRGQDAWKTATFLMLIAAPGVVTAAGALHWQTVSG